MARFGGLLGAFGIYLIVLLVILLRGLVTGVILHWLIAAIDLGVAVLIGLIANGLALHYFIRLETLLESVDPAGPEPTLVAPPAFDMYPLSRLPPMPARRPRKRKP